MSACLRFDPDFGVPGAPVRARGHPGSARARADSRVSADRRDGPLRAGAAQGANDARTAAYLPPASQSASFASFSSFVSFSGASLSLGVAGSSTSSSSPMAATSDAVARDDVLGLRAIGRFLHDHLHRLVAQALHGRLPGFSLNARKTSFAPSASARTTATSRQRFSPSL